MNPAACDCGHPESLHVAKGCNGPRCGCELNAFQVVQERSQRRLRAEKPLEQHDCDYRCSEHSGEWRWDCDDCRWTGLNLSTRESAEREHAHIAADVAAGVI